MAGFFSKFKEKFTKAGQKPKLKETLTKTRQNFVSKVKQLVTVHKKIDEELYEELEDSVFVFSTSGSISCINFFGHMPI
jgi:signal recognition particle GTPase